MELHDVSELQGNGQRSCKIEMKQIAFDISAEKDKNSKSQNKKRIIRNVVPCKNKNDKSNDLGQLGCVRRPSSINYKPFR
jgi:hypothetical protein